MRLVASKEAIPPRHSTTLIAYMIEAFLQPYHQRQQAQRQSSYICWFCAAGARKTDSIPRLVDGLLQLREKRRARSIDLGVCTANDGAHIRVDSWGIW